MRLAMMGSGGIGGYYGGRMAAAGHDVTFIARGSHLEAMQQNGLAIESRDRSIASSSASSFGIPPRQDMP